MSGRAIARVLIPPSTLVWAHGSRAECVQDPYQALQKAPPTAFDPLSLMEGLIYVYNFLVTPPKGPW